MSEENNPAKDVKPYYTFATDSSTGWYTGSYNIYSTNIGNDWYTSGTVVPKITCDLCGVQGHKLIACSKLKSIEYYESGGVKKIEKHQ